MLLIILDCETPRSGAIGASALRCRRHFLRILRSPEGRNPACAPWSPTSKQVWCTVWAYLSKSHHHPLFSRRNNCMSGTTYSRPSSPASPPFSFFALLLRSLQGSFISLWELERQSGAPSGHLWAAPPCARWPPFLRWGTPLPCHLPCPQCPPGPSRLLPARPPKLILSTPDQQPGPAGWGSAGLSSDHGLPGVVRWRSHLLSSAWQLPFSCLRGGQSLHVKNGPNNPEMWP